MPTTGWRIPTGPGDGPPPDPDIVAEKVRRPLGLAGGLLWAGVIAVIASWLLSRLWPDAPPWSGKVWTAVSWAALATAAFAPHIGVGTFGLGAAALLVKRWRLALTAGLVGSLLLAPALLAAQRGAGPGAPAGEPTLRVMSVNLNAGLGSIERVAAQIEASDADIVLLQEMTPQLQQALCDALGERYPHRAMLPRTDCFGQGVLSRLKFVDVPKNRPPGGEKAGWLEPQIGVRVKFDGRLVEIWNVHLLPPVSLGAVRRQHENGAALKEMAVRSGSALILAGDFNSPRLAGPVRGLTRAGLREAHEAAGAGLGLTWPFRLRAPFTSRRVAIPGVRIDHVLYSPDLECVLAEVGEEFGSDHRAVTATLVWADDGWPPVVAGD